MSPSRICAAVLSLATVAALAEEAHRKDLPRERAEWNAILREDANGVVSSENRLKALRHACEMPVDPSMANTKRAAAATFPGVAWESLGPRPMKSAYAGLGSVSGRTTAI